MSDFQVASLSDDEIQALSGESLDNAPGATTETTETVENTKTETTVIPNQTLIPGEIPSMTEEELSVLGAEPTTTEDAQEDSGKSKDNKPTTENTKSTGLDRTQYYKMLVESGEWFSVEDEKGQPIEDLELDDESFQELAIKQAQWKAESVLQQKEEELGEQYKSFYEFIKNGGRVEDLAKFEADQKNIDSYDPEDPDHAEELIKNYQEALGASDKNTKKYIEFLKDQGADALSEAAEEAKEALVKAIQEDRQTLLQEQERQARYQRESQEKYIKTFKEAIYKDSTPDREKKELEKFYFDTKHVIEGGRKASDYLLKIQEIQSDPAKFLKLVKMVKDFDSVGDKKEIEKETNKKTFQLIREGNITRKNTEFPEETKKQKQTFNRPTTFDRFK